MFRNIGRVATCLAIGVSAALTATAARAAVPGALYETFGDGGVVALDLADPAVALGMLGDNATNIVAGDGSFYFQDGTAIYASSPALVGLTLVHNNGAAPTGLALDAANGILYESFGADGVTALSVKTGAGIGDLGIPATNMVFGDGTVYIQDGTAIYASSPTLVGLTLVHNNGAAPTGLALDAADGILYESFGADGVTALSVKTGAGIGDLGIPATNMVFGDGTVYIQDGTAIYTSSADLVGLTLFHDNGTTPLGLAYLPASTPNAVPEPPTLALILMGFFGVILLASRQAAVRT